MNQISMDEKAEYIDKILGFYLDSPFLSAASAFPDPESEVENWYRIARVFNAVFTASKLDDSNKQFMFLLVEDAISEMTASKFTGMPPDMEQELGYGYDDYDIPAGFEKKWHSLIWEKVITEYNT
ncbi:MAG: hypothetical protein LPK85_13295 [Gammaproteobacteria bacterium]|nr:hypothetical protein [Gammaproteobacteria bacterium]